MTDNFKVQVSYKFGGYDEHMINVRGDSATEVEALVKALDIQALTDFGATLKAGQAATAVTTPTGAASAAAGAASGATGASAATPASTAPGNGGRYCTHGPRTRRNGTSARGAWVGWFCPLAKGHPDQCKAEFE